MGRVMVAGGNPGMKAPSTGILAGTLSVGSVVKLMEGGSAVEYIVVNQGKPSGSSLYDDSCDGTWLLRKNIYTVRSWHTSDVNKYESSAIHTSLNGDFFSSLGAAEQAAIKQVKIPYRQNGGYGGTTRTNANGLSCKIFLLSGYEVGYTTSSNNYFPIDGAKLDYFSASSDGNSMRVALLNGSHTAWWLRSPNTGDTDRVWYISSNGSAASIRAASDLFGIRPALVLPKTALFDEDTLQLKGVA